ncbi:hypothetical protein DFH07DRAFT_57340 [Mycena maculata]|uniref:Uncharacterized protein n=1 Tax=Mycena maculata TaxID=230809 RepID=A0AAD7IGH7_9AGAR|nr:hypothetical protein DFH07DRAFT_57340 [Mycena maculata]
MHSASDALDKEALAALKLALDNVHSYLTVLKKPHRRVTSWILANQEKDRFTRLNSALDRALALFSSAEIVSTAHEVRSNTHTVGALATNVGRVDSNLTVIRADLDKLLDMKLRGSKTTAFVLFSTSDLQLIFFFRSVGCYLRLPVGMETRTPIISYLVTYAPLSTSVVLPSP